MLVVCTAKSKLLSVSETYKNDGIYILIIILIISMEMLGNNMKTDQLKQSKKCWHQSMISYFDCDTDKTEYYLHNGVLDLSCCCANTEL